MRAFRFGVILQGDGSPVEAARRAEGSGYSALHVPDHTRMLAPIPAMTAAAAATSRLRVGATFNVMFRPLAVLAQDLAAVDLLSDGRLEAGLGAGAAERDLADTGRVFPPAGVRVAEVARALEVLPRMFAGEFVDGTGMLNPLPPQGKDVPLMVGGNGDRLLAIAAKGAATVQFLGYTPRPGGRDYGNFTEEKLAERVAYVRGFGRDVELAIVLQAAGITADPIAAVSDMGLVKSGKATAEEALRSPFVQFGRSAAEVRDRLLAMRERHGISYVTVFAARSPGFEKVIADLL